MERIQGMQSWSLNSSAYLVKRRPLSGFMCSFFVSYMQDTPQSAGSPGRGVKGSGA